MENKSIRDYNIIFEGFTMLLMLILGFVIGQLVFSIFKI